MEYSSQTIVNQIMEMQYLLPKEDELKKMLTVRKFAPVCVELQRYADFVTGNTDEFLRFLRVNNIKAVLYSYRFYREEDLEQKYQLEDGDKSLFFSMEQELRQSRYHLEARSYSRVRTEESDYANYLRYVKFVRTVIDLCHPKELRLYAICQGKVIACQRADAWLERLPAPDGQYIRKYAMEHNLGTGDLTFNFH